MYCQEFGGNFIGQNVYHRLWKTVVPVILWPVLLPLLVFVMSCICCMCRSFQSLLHCLSEIGDGRCVLQLICCQLRHSLQHIRLTNNIVIATVSVIFSSGPKFCCLFQGKMLSLFLLFLFCHSIDDFHKILIVVKREHKYADASDESLSLRF